MIRIRIRVEWRSRRSGGEDESGVELEECILLCLYCVSPSVCLLLSVTPPRARHQLDPTGPPVPPGPVPIVQSHNCSGLWWDSHNGIRTCSYGAEQLHLLRPPPCPHLAAPHSPLHPFRYRRMSRGRRKRRRGEVHACLICYINVAYFRVQTLHLCHAWPGRDTGQRWVVSRVLTLVTWLRRHTRNTPTQRRQHTQRCQAAPNSNTGANGGPEDASLHP